MKPVRPHSAYNRSVMTESPGKWESKHEMSKHVERIYWSEYNSAWKERCDSCYEGEARHHWPTEKPIKLGRRLPLRVLRSLYGKKASLLPEPKEKAGGKKRP